MRLDGSQDDTTGITTWSRWAIQGSVPGGHGGQSRVQFLVWARACLPFQNVWAGSWPTRAVSGVLYMRLDAEHSPPSGAEVINEWNYTPAFRMALWCLQEQLCIVSVMPFLCPYLALYPSPS